MDTITISKKEYKRLFGVKRTKGLKEAKKFEFSKTAKFIGMWKDRKDISSGASWVNKIREKENKRSQKV